jgi:hypothetical protein
MTIYDAMLNGVSKLVSGESNVTVSAMLISSVSSDIVGSEFDRITTSNSSSGVNSLFEMTRSSVSANNEVLAGVGLMTSISGGELWADTVMSSLVHTTDFDFEVVYQIKFSK